MRKIITPATYAFDPKKNGEKRSLVEEVDESTGEVQRVLMPSMTQPGHVKTVVELLKNAVMGQPITATGTTRKPYYDGGNGVPNIPAMDLVDRHAVLKSVEDTKQNALKESRANKDAQLKKREQEIADREKALTQQKPPE